MKKSLFLAGILLAFLPAISQTTDSLQQKKHAHLYFPQVTDIGVSILLDGLIDNISLGSKNSPFGNKLLFGRYYFDDDKAFRIGFGLDLVNTKREQADSVGLNLVEKDSTFNNYSISISFGIEKHLASSSRLDPYVAADIALAFIGKNKTEIERRETSAAGVARMERTITQDGGLGFALLGNVGFNYFLANNFSIGSELGLGFSIIRRGGATTDNTVNTPINGSATATYVVRNDKTTNVNIGVDPTASIHLSYFF